MSWSWITIPGGWVLWNVDPSLSITVVGIVVINDEETGIKKYKAYINDKWALFEYEPKKNYIQFRPDNFINLKNENNLLIEIEDMVGNVTIYREIFYFKN